MPVPVVILVIQQLTWKACGFQHGACGLSAQIKYVVFLGRPMTNVASFGGYNVLCKQTFHVLKFKFVGRDPAVFS